MPPLLKKGAEGNLREQEKKLGDMIDSVQRDPFGTLNRLQDQWRVWETLRLEEVGNDSTVLYEQPLTKDGHETAQHPTAIIAKGYERVIYGDDGPYVELSKSQICWDAFPNLNEKNHDTSYYDEYFTSQSYAIWKARWERWDPKPCQGLLMLYDQHKTVEDRPWAPSASVKPHPARDNGYADYRPGYYYVSANRAVIATEKSLTIPEKDSSHIAADEAASAAWAQRRMSGKEKKEFLICWSFRAGECDRGKFCKWQHDGISSESESD